MCEVNQQGCFRLGDKICQVAGGRLPVDLEAIPVVKSNIDMLTRCYCCGRQLYTYSDFGSRQIGLSDTYHVRLCCL